MIKILILSVSFIFVFSSDDINLENKNLDIIIANQENTLLKTKKDYEDKDRLKTPPMPLDMKETIEKKDIEVDGKINIDKDAKKIDGVNINLGTKF